MTHPDPAAPQSTPTPEQERDTEKDDLPTGWVETTLGEVVDYGQT